VVAIKKIKFENEDEGKNLVFDLIIKKLLIIKTLK
jgi:hypothetical protein